MPRIVASMMRHSLIDVALCACYALRSLESYGQTNWPIGCSVRPRRLGLGKKRMMNDTHGTRYWLYSALVVTLAAQHACTSMARNPSGEVCLGYGTSVLLHGDLGKLYLCRQGREIKSYSVAFGSQGLGKETVGDRKTPVGSFRLSRPRSSASGFKTFIGINLPRNVGIAVGIHGPKRGARWLGPFNTLVNWTAGCIAVSSDAETDEVAAFVKAHPNARIHIKRGPI